MQRLRHIFRTFRIAVAGTEKTFTTGSIDRAIFLLAVPMILEMVMESLFAVVDVFFVAKLGKAAVTTVGLTESVITLVYSMAIGLSMAATAVVARRTGEEDGEGAARSAVQAIAVGIGISLLVGIAGVVFAKDILLLMGENPAVAEAHQGYTRIVFGSNVVITLLFLINGIFRGAGDASIAMRSLWLANGLNIVLCPLLIYGLGPVKGMGLIGAAWATTVGRGCGVLYQCYFLYRGKGIMRIAARHLRLQRDLILQILKLGAGGAGQFLINSASWIFLARIVSSFGEEAVAGYTIGMRMLVFTILPAWGIANAAATLVGQNLGAGQPQRAEKSVWRTASFSFAFMCAVTVLYWCFSDAIIRQFTTDPAVMAYGVDTLRYVTLGYPLLAYGLVLNSSFNGAGDTRTPIWINLAGFWAFQIPLAFCLAIVAGLGPQGVFLAVAIAESAIAVAAIVIFKRGRWKKVVV